MPHKDKQEFNEQASKTLTTPGEGLENLFGAAQTVIKPKTANHYSGPRIAVLSVVFDLFVVVIALVVYLNIDSAETNSSNPTYSFPKDEFDGNPNPNKLAHLYYTPIPEALPSPTPGILNEVKGVLEIGSQKTELKSAFFKLSSNKRTIEIGLFDKILTADEIANLKSLSNLSLVDAVNPNMLLTLQFSPFRTSCDLVSLSSYVIRIYMDSVGSQSVPYLEFPRSMASNKNHEIETIRCARRKGNAMFEIILDGKDKSRVNASEISFYWNITAKGML